MKNALLSGLPFVLVISLGAGVALAQDNDATPTNPEAESNYQAGLGHYEKKDYAAAIAAFERARAIEPRPEILFAMAQALRVSGDCDRALVVFQDFLATDPPERQVQAARISMKLCTDRVEKASPKQDTVVTTPVPVPAVSLPEPEIVHAAPPPVPADALTYAITLTGVGAILAGGAVLFSGHALDARATANDSEHGIYDHDRTTAETRVAAGITTIVLGGALVAGGVARYMWLTVDRDAQAAQAGIRGLF